jgi:predicted ATPase/class 3 adenylate cyclase
MDDLIRLNTPAEAHYAFLFTDIEGSTARWAEFPDHMGAALARHDALLRDVVRAAGGTVFKTTGDGGHAVFTTVATALEAAVALQARMAAQDFGAVGGMRLRVGVHCGPAELRDGDYYGLVLSRTARIMAAGHGGQVLVSAAAAGAVGDAASGFSLRSLGAHRLKDLGPAEELFQLHAPGLPIAFPPLRALDSRPNNLPLQISAFIGRETELETLRGLLASQKLVTLLGPGGIGKTRLALQAVAAAVEGYPDGVWFVELAGLTEPAQVAPTVAAALNITLGDADDRDEQLASALRGAAMLIILDNCEHLVAAAASLAAALLRRNSGVRILATSRSSLGLPGEQIFELPTLAVPEIDASPTMMAKAAAGYAAVRLFVDRAGLVQPGFRLDADNVADIVAICRRLDGIALAIELAAARTRLMRPKELLARLNDRFRLLTGGGRTSAARQQTLRATIDWSFDLLDEAERVVLRRLGVFAGSFDLDGAEAVISGGPIGTADVLELLAALLDKSLITRLTAQDRPPRYRLLDSTRHYALEKLEEAGETAALQRAHALHMVALFGEARRRYPETDTIVWRADVEPDIENLQAALAWAFCDDGDAGIAIALVARLSPLVTEALIDWGTFRSLGRAAIKKLAPDTPLEDAARLWANLTSDHTATPRAVAASAETAQALFHALGDVPMEGLTAAIAAYYLTLAGDEAGAQVRADVAYANLNKFGPNLTSARILYILAACPSVAARRKQAFPDADDDNIAALKIYRKFNNQTGILEVSANLADKQARSGDYAGAIESTMRSAVQNCARRDWLSLHCDLVNQTTFCLLAGDDAAAARAAREALPYSLEPFDQAWTSAFTGSLALLAARAGALETAAKLAGYTSHVINAVDLDLSQKVEQRVWDALMALFTQAESLATLPAAVRARLMEEGAALSLEAVLNLALEFLPGEA